MVDESPPLSALRSYVLMNYSAITVPSTQQPETVSPNVDERSFRLLRDMLSVEGVGGSNKAVYSLQGDVGMVR